MQCRAVSSSRALFGATQYFENSTSFPESVVSPFSFRVGSFDHLVGNVGSFNHEFAKWVVSTFISETWVVSTTNLQNG